jgi:hypothetical protein
MNEEVKSEQEQANSDAQAKQKELETKFYPEQKKEGETEESNEKKESEAEEPGESEQSEKDDVTDKDETSKEESKEKQTEFDKTDLQLPPESTLTEESLEGIVSFAKEQGLSREQAQALVDRENNVFADHLDGLKEQQLVQAEGWMEEMQKDEVFGGDNLKVNAELARRALQKFGDERLLKDLETANLGNHPGLSRMLMRIGKAMSEDELIKGEVPVKKKSYEELFYGNNN